MTPEYAAMRLLQHGPLTFGELITITGWKSRQVERVIYSMVDSGVVDFTVGIGQRRRLYSLAP